MGEHRQRLESYKDKFGGLVVTGQDVIIAQLRDDVAELKQDVAGLIKDTRQLRWIMTMNGIDGCTD
jgi:hypothetical protein